MSIRPHKRSQPPVVHVLVATLWDSYRFGICSGSSNYSVAISAQAISAAAVSLRNDAMELTIKANTQVSLTVDFDKATLARKPLDGEEDKKNEIAAGTQTDNKKKIATDTQTKPATVTVWRAVAPKKDPKKRSNYKMKFHGSGECPSLRVSEKVVTSSEFAKNELPSPSKRCKRFDCWVANDLQVGVTK